MHRQIKNLRVESLGLKAVGSAVRTNRCSIGPHSGPYTSRSGITLFEVVLALAIFLGATAVIGQVLQNGSRAATKAQLTADAAIRCEKRMNELLSGVLPLTSVQNAPFEDDASWQWSVTVLDTSVISLLEAEVVVQHVNSRGTSDLTYRANRYIKDPQIYEDAAIIPEEEL